MLASPLLDATDLRAKLGQAVLLDVRTGRDARAQYEAAHLPGALFVDVDAELAERGDPARGGRHPLPSVARFVTQVGRWGIAPATEVVVYDAQSGANAAARAWWMLRALGHTRVSVLDGGYQAALRAGIPTTADIPLPLDRGPYPADGWQLPTIDADGIDAWRRDASKVVIDARSPKRFAGHEEPLDPVAGHIPGAVNLFHQSLVGADGRFLAPDVIAALFQELVGERPIDAVAVHCGSGITACHLILALEHAGLGIPTLYVGSWSEWCRAPRPREPAATRV